MKDTAEPIGRLYPSMECSYQHDYEEVRRLLATPSRIALAIGALEFALCAIPTDDPRFHKRYRNERNGYTRFDRLEIALLDMEARFGFSHVIRIAPGGTPFDDPNYGSNRIRVDAWTAMIRAGHPMRDYGASRPHGEITHRVQWYVICAAFESGDLVLEHAGAGAILSLYRAATLPAHRRRYHRPSDGVEYVKSVWSDLFDYGLTKIIDGRSTIWLQRELLFCDWGNYYPELSLALRQRFVARGGSLDRWHPENEQFFNGSGMPAAHRS